MDNEKNGNKKKTEQAREEAGIHFKASEKERRKRSGAPGHRQTPSLKRRICPCRNHSWLHVGRKSQEEVRKFESAQLHRTQPGLTLLMSAVAGSTHSEPPILRGEHAHRGSGPPSRRAEHAGAADAG